MLCGGGLLWFVGLGHNNCLHLVLSSFVINSAHTLHRGSSGYACLVLRVNARTRRHPNRVTPFRRGEGLGRPPQAREGRGVALNPSPSGPTLHRWARYTGAHVTPVTVFDVIVLNQAPGPRYTVFAAFLLLIVIDIVVIRLFFILFGPRSRFIALSTQ